MLPLEGSPGKWALHNACIVYRMGRLNTSVPGARLYGDGLSHWNYPVGARIFSRNNLSANILGFSEMRGYGSAGTVRTEEQAGTLDLNRCDQRANGLAVFLANNNIYHLNFHVVTAFESLRDHAGPDVILLPWIGRLSTDHEPLTASKMHVWEYSVRALTASTSKALVRDLHRLFSAPCTCVEHLWGDTGAFEPRAVGARTRWAAFTHAALANSRLQLGLPSAAVPSRDTRIIYVSRSSSRRVVNEADLLRVIFQLAPFTRSVQLETMTVAEQMIAIASSHIFVAGHGAALAWLPFLAGAQERAACIEIVIPHHPATYKSRSMYSRVAVGMGLHYQRISTKFTNATKCPGARKKERAILKCDNDARVVEVQPAVQRALDFISRSRGQGLSESNVWCAHFRPCLAGETAPKELMRPLANTRRPQLVAMNSGAEILRGSPGKWLLHNSCVAYHRDHRNVTSVQFISRSNIFAHIEGYVGASHQGAVATVRPMTHAAELDGCDFVDRVVAVSNLRTEAREAELLLPLGRDISVRLSWPTGQRTLAHLLRLPCLCFDHVFGDTGPSPVISSTVM